PWFSRPPSGRWPRSGFTRAGSAPVRGRSENTWIRPPRFAGLANFRALWSDRYFWIALENSVTYLAVVPVLQGCAILLALWVHRSARGLGWLRAAYYLPVVTSIVVVGMLWRWLYDDAGLVNYLLLQLRLLRGPVHWLS